MMKLIASILMVFALVATADAQIAQRPVPQFIESLSDADYATWVQWQNRQAERRAKRSVGSLYHAPVSARRAIRDQSIHFKNCGCSLQRPVLQRDGISQKWSEWAHYYERTIANHVSLHGLPYPIPEP